MQWYYLGRKPSKQTPTVPFVVEGKKVRHVKSHGPLSFLKTILSPIVFLYCFCVCCDDVYVFFIYLMFRSACSYFD